MLAWLSPAVEAGLTLPTPPLVRAWDGIFSTEVLRTLALEGDRRDHSFTSVFTREHAVSRGRTIIEAALCALLDEVGDESRHVEYWWRGEWISMAAHRDVDEALCRSRTRGAAGVQRCPKWGHVLYLDVDDGVRGPTCVWEEDREPEVNGAEAAALSGAPRTLRTLHVVPARSGRLLRFRGDMLHAVPKPPLEWVPSQRPIPDPVCTSGRRSVVLFNTWGSEPPTIPTPDEPAAPSAVAALKPLTCVPHAAWRAVQVNGAAQRRPRDETDKTRLENIEATLLGDERRRGCSRPIISVKAEAEALLSALTSANDVHAVALHPPDTYAADAADSSPMEAPVEVDTAEELAIRLGYAEYMEAEFFGTGDGGSDWDDDDDDGDW